MKNYDIRQTPFSLHGLADKENLRRLPADLRDKVNDGVTNLCTHTSGARVRFATDSEHMTVHVRLSELCRMPHMPLSGSSGVDVFCNGVFTNCLMADTYGQWEYTREITFKQAGEKELCLYLPLYNGISQMEIGLDDGASLSAPKPYTHPKQVVFYGSSITQGACASRPSNCYINLVSRRLDTEIYNLGFSGSARGEQTIADYIAGLDMAVFVLDYDHNAPSVEHLQNTHRDFFDTVRAAHPDLPIVMLSRPDYEMCYPETEQRRQIVRATYDAAVAAGDRNVYFVDGKSLFGDDDRGACTMEGCHPNDLGFYRMAKTVMPVVAPLLK